VVLYLVLQNLTTLRSTIPEGDKNIL